MRKSLFIFITILITNICSAQSLTFDNAVRQLFFGVDILKAKNSILDTLSSVKNLHRSNTTTKRLSMDVGIDSGDGGGLEVTRSFVFTKSPVAGLSIKKGSVNVTMGEAGDLKKLLGLSLWIGFANKAQAEAFFDNLKKMFLPLSTKHDISYEKGIGWIAQYSTRKSTDAGIKDIGIFFIKQAMTKRYEMRIEIFNEFSFEEKVVQ
ncbi:MAG: hypothetical protein JWQ27_2387 [Ferruginibacter sp.]|nr:hypothetical protein [Ferruginibacter sp.]